MSQPLEINGWKIYFHPCFLTTFNDMKAEVVRLRNAHPDTYMSMEATQRFRAVLKVITQIIPADPGAEVFRQGKTMGAVNKQWKRVKFLQQYRLFFRYHSGHKIIILAWVNDESTLRAYGSKTDAYKTFKKMLGNGNPPGDWDTLLKASTNDPNYLR